LLPDSAACCGDAPAHDADVQRHASSTGLHGCVAESSALTRTVRFASTSADKRLPARMLLFYKGLKMFDFLM
jgi:hypothetical protein